MKSKLETALLKQTRRSAKDKSVPPPVGVALGVSKISISLYAVDLARLDEIKAFMLSRGHRNLGDSEALRLACRGAEISDRLVEIYHTMQSEDRRRRKSSRVA